MVLSAHQDLKGDVSSNFEPLTEAAGRAVLETFFGAAFDDAEVQKELEAEGTTLAAVIDRHIEYVDTTRCLCTEGAGVVQ